MDIQYLKNVIYAEHGSNSEENPRDHHSIAFRISIMTMNLLQLFVLFHIGPHDGAFI